ncbi:hypothetical protein [Streptomyces sp. NPDC048663]|uniref:hypothetical protein n=1 Tax=Streptomyces sp. NPDC048663 TaxID=3155638 RepID=UPI003418F3E2
MPSSIPPLPGLTRYTWWGAVPEGLLTKTQLDRQGLKPGSDPVGQVLYHGNCYAPLYEVTAAVAKRTCSPAQRAALDRARELQHECRRCGVREDEPLGKGRYCDRGCRYAMTMWEQHDQAQTLARELVADPAAVLLVVDVERDALPSAQGVAVVGVRDHQVLYTAQAGEYGTSERGEVLDRLDALLADRRVVEEPDHMGPSSRYPHRLISQPGQPLQSGPDPQHPWAAPHSNVYPSVARIWSAWFAWTNYPGDTIASIPQDGAGVPWSRSLDVAEDGRSMATLLHRIADGTAPVWERAAWTLDGHGVPAVLSRQRTAA